MSLLTIHLGKTRPLHHATRSSRLLSRVLEVANGHFEIFDERAMRVLLKRVSPEGSEFRHSSRSLDKGIWSELLPALELLHQLLANFLGSEAEFDPLILFHDMEEDTRGLHLGNAIVGASLENPKEILARDFVQGLGELVLRCTRLSHPLPWALEDVPRHATKELEPCCHFLARIAGVSVEL